jgi:hypothetical protein
LDRDAVANYELGQPQANFANKLVGVWRFWLFGLRRIVPPSAETILDGGGPDLKLRK